MWISHFIYIFCLIVFLDYFNYSDYFHDAYLYFEYADLLFVTLIITAGISYLLSNKKKNLITIFTYTNNIVVLFNKVVIIKHIENDLEVEDEAEESEDSTNNKAKAKFGFGISGQNNFIVDKIEIKELGIKEFIHYQSLLMDGTVVKGVIRKDLNLKECQSRHSVEIEGRFT